MLDIRPNCECCGKNLPADSKDALICTFECTFCNLCAETLLNYKCSNCGGNLVERPIRPAELLEKYPASTDRILKEEGCVSHE